MSVTGVHPYAEKFPMLPDAELAELAESIRANGLRSPIVVTPEGLILDGRNRAAACERVGVKADTVVYPGDDLAEYVIDANASRRHMSTGSRAMSTALVLAADGRRNGQRWRRGSVGLGNTESRNTWQDALRQCGIILDFAPDLAEQVVSGDLALDAAFRQAEERRDAERNQLAEQERIAAEEADARTFIEEHAPDLAALVGVNLETYAEAKAVWEKRNREEAARLRAEQERQERLAREEQANSEQHCQHMANALATLHEHTYPEARQRSIEIHWPRGAEGARPAARALRTPDTLRKIARALTAYAQEMETLNAR